MTDQEIYNQLDILKKEGVDACLATIVETYGSTPRGMGAKMIVCADGTSFGSVGGGCGERQVENAAFRCFLSDEKSIFLEVSLQDDLGTKEGDVCGGRMWVFIEQA